MSKNDTDTVETSAATKASAKNENGRRLHSPQKTKSPARNHLDQSQFDSENIDTFFENDSHLPTRSVAIISICCILLAGLLVAFLNTGASDFIFKETSVQEASSSASSYLNLRAILITLVPAALLSFVASLIAVGLINTRNFRKNYSIRRLAHDDLLKHIFGILSQYRQVHRYDQSIRLTLRPSKLHPNVFMAELQVSHSTFLTNNTTLVFRKVRSSTQDRNGFAEIGIFDQEYIISIQEKAVLKYIDDKEGSVEKLYRIKDVAINNSHDNLHARDNAPADQWIYDINSSVREEDINKIDFTIEFPITANGFYNISVLFPTKNLNAVLDYRAVKEFISPSVVTMLNAAKVTENFDKDDGETITVRYDGWLIPKSNIFFIWYDKNLSQKYKTKDTEGS